VRSLGHYAYRWRGRIVLAALVVAIAAAIGGASVFDAVKPYGFQDPDSESARATEALEDASLERPLPDVVLLIEPQRSGPSQLRRAANHAAGTLIGVPRVVRAVTPATEPQLVSQDKRSGLVIGYVDSAVGDIAEVGAAVERRFEDDPEVIPGGTAVTANQLNETTEADLRRIELFAAPVLFLLSLLVFRGLVAAALPLVIGVLSIVLTLVLLRLLTEVMEIDVYVVNIVVGLGLGLAIDYSLFLVTRFRDELEEGQAAGAAVRNTLGSTGRMILYSGLTVAVALAALTVFPQRFLYSIGVGGALVALTSVFVSLTVLPAMLSVLGSRVNALAPRWLQSKPSTEGWAGLGRAVLRHPALIATVVVALMVALSLPFLRVELTRADAGVLPAASSAHQVDNAIDKRFAGDPSSVIDVVLTERASAPELAAARRELAETPTVEAVGKAERFRDVYRIDAQLSVDPFSDKALEVVDVARALDWGAPSLINGAPAELADQRTSLADHLPAAIAIIVFSTLLLLFVMTRSVVLPVLALLMNALTVGVAFGVLVVIFQDGNFQGLLDYRTQGAIDTSIPILLFAVVFGLSTDYGVFLLQRISEQRGEGVDERDAITRGLAQSGRPITAAALLFAVAMGAFVFSDLIFLKEIAVGTAVAVLIDATLVRAFLLPAVLGLLGRWAWWAPACASRLPSAELR
jgi:RND superfamily putative drug exporter